MDRLERPVLRPLVWLGDSKGNLQGFPKGAQKLLGDELQLIQFGGTPKDAKPFKGVGSGLFCGGFYPLCLRRLSRGDGSTAGHKNLCSARLSEEVEGRH